ncbi:MAG: HIT domain-containing protein, partial [archaeon]|nr:HIT domain-containing protein [archaeon]
KKHYETILDMPSSLGSELVDIAKKQGLRLIKEGKAEGFNLFQNNFKSAGQVVLHYHMHVIPRKINDNFKPFE